MRFIEDLCPPALLYLIFLVIQLGFDLSLGMIPTFVVKLVFGIAVVVILDMFCGVGLGVVSWVLIATPFVVTALATAIAMGTKFDQTILIAIRGKEKFETPGEIDDAPEDSNAIDSAEESPSEEAPAGETDSDAIRRQMVESGKVTV